MPRVKKKRGKFTETREKKRQAKADEASHNAKRRKLAHGDDAEADAENGFFFEDTTPAVGIIDGPQQPPDDEMVFYGLLDENEQAYYANVNAKITSDDFEDAEEKASFIDAVYRESRGKEMKLASSQSCSRHLERILMVSSADQLRDFFQAISEGLTQLVQHRFGSHVCETLFLQAAAHVPSEGTADEEDDEKPSITALFLQAAELLKQNMGFMLTDRFASHTVRVLLLVLSGEPLEDPTSKTMLASKRKENLKGPSAPEATAAESRKVPKSFLEATSSLTTAAVASLDTTYLRALATHSTGNPVLQLLLRLELKHSDKGRALGENSLFHRLVAPDSLDVPESEGAKFVSGLTFDSTGSRLVEVLVVDTPGKIFKKLYKGIWKERMPSMAKNDIASFVAIKIIVRLGKDELLELRDGLLPELHLLLRRRRFSVIKALIDRSMVRGLDFKPLIEALKRIFPDDVGGLLQQLLYPPSGSPEEDAKQEVKADLHGSLLAQALLEVESLGFLVRDAISAMQSEQLLNLANDSSGSRVLQTSLTTPTASTAYKKQVIPKFYGHVAELALSSVGSYVIDALWEATNGLHFMKERLASELASHESELRDSYTGRKVWRNWSMDLYARRRGEWQAQAKGTSDLQQEPEARKKTPIELARQRRAEEKAKLQQQESKPLVSANA